MVNDFYEGCLRPQNQCRFTGLEILYTEEKLGVFYLSVFKDHLGGLRVILKDENTAICSLLFDHTGECSRRYTKEEFRGQRLSKQLFAYMQWKFPKMNLRHSQNMTVAGRASV